MLVPPAIASLIDWAVLALCGAVASASLAGALYSVPWTRRGRRSAPTRAFNYLWATRFTLQVVGALLALAQALRLQVLWSYRSAVIPGGYHVDPMCRLYIGLTFGVLEPAFLLLVLFSCMYTVHKQREEVGPSPNLFIFALTLGLTLPMCAAQVFAALFSRIITQLRYHEDLMKEFFAASIGVSDAMCPPDARANPNCAVCVFPAFSTLISAAFGAVYLLSLWAVTGAIAAAAINATLSRRIRALQLTVTLFFCAGIALRGATVRYYPYSAEFAALAVAQALATCGLLAGVSCLLGWAPVGETRAAGRSVGAEWGLLPPPFGAGAAGSSLTAAAAGGERGGGATELLPLVDHGGSGISGGGGGSFTGGAYRDSGDGGEGGGLAAADDDGGGGAQLPSASLGGPTQRRRGG